MTHRGDDQRQPRRHVLLDLQRLLGAVDLGVGERHDPDVELGGPGVLVVGVPGPPVEVRIEAGQPRPPRPADHPHPRPGRLAGFAQRLGDRPQVVIGGDAGVADYDRRQGGAVLLDRIGGGVDRVLDRRHRRAGRPRELGDRLVAGYDDVGKPAAPHRPLRPRRQPDPVLEVVGDRPADELARYPLEERRRGPAEHRALDEDHVVAARPQ